MPSRIYILFATLLVCSLPSCKKQESRANEDSTTNDRGITITSDNEPKNDSEALDIIAIKINPNPKVMFRKYEAGLDDSMMVVLEMSPKQFQTFKDTIPWSDQLSATRTEHFPTNSNKIWSSQKLSKIGQSGNYTLPNSEYVRVYVADDLAKGSKRVFLFWHQT
jgi:hypothetical protein|tara:strand:+ start:1504 stop:1995 length:492 start_codon:yes stop_codon:yes gene_type:complete